MPGSNYRIVETDRGYSIFEVFYDSRGNVVRRGENPLIDCYADNACGVTDWLEAISLAAEKPSIGLKEMERAMQLANGTHQRARPNHEQPD